MEETCMFCLEPLKQNEQALNPIGCECNFKAHGQCLQSWFEQKQQYECPICHVVCIINPVEQYVQQPVVQVVYVNRESTSPSTYQISEGQQKCLGICCFMLIFWALTTSIADMILRK